MDWAAALAFGWQRESSWVVAATLVCAALLWRRGGDTRKAAANTALVFIAATLAQLSAGAMHAASMSNGATALLNIALLIAGIAAIRLAGMLVFRQALPACGMNVPRIAEDLTTFVLYAVWMVARLRATGMDPGSILASTAVVTAVIAFALQDTLGNILGGLAIQFDNSIKIGDWVRIDDTVGRVADIRWRSTSIETRDWETVVVPNSALMKGRFAVLGKRTDEPLKWRRHVRFSVDLSAAPPRVIPTIEQAIRESEIAHAARTPEPSCVLLGFEHGYANYDLRYWLTDLRHDDPTDSQVRIHVFTALQRQGWRLAVAEHGVRMTEETEAHRRTVEERELARRMTALSTIDLFASLTAPERRAVASHLTYSPFAQGEIITRQGNVAHWLYILTAGEADIVVDSEGHERRFVNTLGAGSFFGEAGLLTGAPRAATVIARSNVDCYRLDKAGFEDVLRSRPSMAEEMSRVMAARQSALAAAVHGEEGSMPAARAGGAAEWLARIRTFFAIGG
ncbi:MAG: mechanosensitive ion channel [Burkholderiales bacterium]|nr:mechanosensitive ion channel [Burkholderiales bacterium]